MGENKSESTEINDNLKEIQLLLKHLIALHLNESGVTQAEIGKKTRLAKATVNKMLKGVKVTDKNLVKKK